MDGQDIYDEGYDMKALRSKVGLVFQYPDHQLFETTCFEDVCFGPKNQGLDRRDIELRAFEGCATSGFRKSYFISRRLICPADRSAVWQSPEYLQ